jgi:hypothetical protein
MATLRVEKLKYQPVSGTLERLAQSVDCLPAKFRPLAGMVRLNLIGNRLDCGLSRKCLSYHAFLLQFRSLSSYFFLLDIV